MDEEGRGLGCRLLRLGCLVVLVVGCSDGGRGGSSPTEPSAPVYNVATCPIQGSVRGSSVTVSPATGGATFCTVQSIACPSAPQRPLRMELRLDRSNLTGTVNGDRLTASGTSVWHVTDARTGQSLGDYEVRSSQDLRKQ
jgi:hypothetical protein